MADPVETERRLSNVVHYGTVEEADYAKARLRIRIGENVTTWIPWAASRAGGDRSWHPPEVGEQILLVAPGGDLNQACVLGSVYQTKHGAPADKATVTRTVWKDGATLEYDRETHAYALDVPVGGTIELRCGASSLRISNEGIVLKAPRIDLNP
ncbi:phage baseplate assembly protein V [Azospirillum agricola]|uniref:phage baseplate assembly protein V n=1 Tax=Azospirillum agricola TaxID=1720247 RepID=UPI001AE3F22E|nr:phage baseplate assembly protein V [Azospirillum agricola]MBP2227550.1 phage baseplate assembly protein V [Azospirillum agricola]